MLLTLPSAEKMRPKKPSQRLQPTLSCDGLLWPSSPLPGSKSDLPKKEGLISFKYNGLVRSLSLPIEGCSRVFFRISKVSKSKEEACCTGLATSNPRTGNEEKHGQKRRQEQSSRQQVLQFLKRDMVKQKKESGFAELGQVREEKEEVKNIEEEEMKEEGSSSLVLSAEGSSVDPLPGSVSPTTRDSVEEKCPPNGMSLQCGRRPEMEDTASVVPSFTRLPCQDMGGCHCSTTLEPRAKSDLHFFGVYDGHGGAQASDYCMQRLHLALAEEVMKVASLEQVEGSDSCKWERAMTDCFLKMDIEVGGVCPTGECNDSASIRCCRCVETVAPENVGSTAVVAVLSPCNIIIGNCGDSRAVLSRSGKAIALSRDHKPEREDELIRIEAAGGRVIYWDGYRVGALLALSRSIGDRYLKEYVISEPEVTCTQRSEEDEFLILASDGLWNVVSNELACDVVRKYLAGHRRKCESSGYMSSSGEDIPATAAANYLSKLAMAKHSRDNVSIVVVDLKSRQL